MLLILTLQVINWYIDDSFACHPQSNTLGPWVMYSGASDIFLGIDQFRQILFIQSLPATSCYCSQWIQTNTKEAGQTNPLSCHSKPYIYVPDCPFNLVSVSDLTHVLNLSIVFLDDSFVMQDLSRGQTTCVRVNHKASLHILPLLISTSCPKDAAYFVQSIHIRL